MSELALALLAGVVTVASPCVLPVLPILLGAAWGHGDPGRPVWIVLGFVAVFAASALVFGISTRVLGVSQDTVRGAAIATLFGFGLLSVFPRGFERLAPALAPLGDRAARAVPSNYATWDAWHNRSWPSLYLVDRDGKLLLRHEGEGGEDAVERAIEAALASAG